jgi:glucan biosynthesis protein
VPDLKCWRLSMLARAPENKPLLLRAFLHSHQEALTETWTYRLEAENDIHKD